MVKAKGGTVVSLVRHPLNALTSSFPPQAQNSKAQVLALANAGGDTINTIIRNLLASASITMKVTPPLVFTAMYPQPGLLKNTEGNAVRHQLVLGHGRRPRKFADKFMAY